MTSPAKALLLYSTTDGHTRRIVEVIAESLAAQGVESDVVDINSGEPPSPERYTAVLIGASIRYGKFKPTVARYASTYAEQLNQKISAFVAVNLTARKEEKRSPTTNAYTHKFLEATPWQPGHCEVVAGALRYPRYRLFDRLMIQLIMKMTGGETDPSKEIDYTDWERVSAFGREWGEQIRAH
ncbi:menaquinone-dependent protoporphyrinogen IX dehydrogenase [Carnimonas nigrificans]|uniref:menaquinone-dependent protoporphyrinogen IX dehydrogenase n=1 Tax=Carnimonas nigrificans TaxID=64323 RepID=UPI000470C22D|nr:menaquinone-dependent protoporphyrinogen IX dehydrogenase [Carnimonas nigrificans]